MARRKATGNSSTEEEAVPGAKSQRWKHEGQLDWMAEKYGYDYNKMDVVEIVSVAFNHRAEWRQSPEYEELVETHRQEKEEEAAERRAARAEETGSGGKRGRPKGSGTKAAADTATKPRTRTKKTATKTAASGRKGRATRATKAAAEDPFDE